MSHERAMERTDEAAEEEIQIDREALVQAFVTEAGEVLAGMEQQLLALEANPGDEETIHALFRGAHTLKGSSSLVSFDDVGELAHAVESLLERIRARALRVDISKLDRMLNLAGEIAISRGRLTDMLEHWRLVGTAVNHLVKGNPDERR